VKLKRLTLENFKGFEALELEFHPRLTVLVGANGSGKTSILEALVSMLSMVSWQPNQTPWHAHGERLGAEFYRLAVEFQHGERPHLYAFDSKPPDQDEREVDSLPSDFPAVPPLCAYSVHREVGRPFDASSRRLRPLPRSMRGIDLGDRIIELGRSTPVDIASQWLTGSDFWQFFEWFLAQEDIENERRLDESSYRNPQLEATRSAIERLMPGYSALRVRRTRSEGGPSLTLKKHGQELDFNQLSEGERNLCALVGDIARRTTLADSDPSAQSHEGIVLIDEIDLHLHPRWQANVLPSLLRTFPELQFVVTTHSPIVLSYVDTECVRLLEGFRLVDAPPTSGRDPNSVLWEVFGVPLHPPEKKIARL